MASGYSDLSEIRKDRTAYGLHQKPPKINLLNEKPRRESLIEQQLTSNIVRPTFSQINNQQQQQFASNQQAVNSRSHEFVLNSGQHHGNSAQYLNRPSTSSFVDLQPPSSSGYNVNYNTHRGVDHPYGKTMTETVQVTRTTTTNPSRDYSDLARELAEKEEKLKREMAYLNQQLSPWSRPPQIREPRREPEPRKSRSEQRWLKECPSGSSSRPASRASSTRSNTEADLMEKAAKLLQDVEELEKKPLKTQQILIESGATSRASQKSTSPVQDVSSIHTAIIKVPTTEIDNKSPLPFAYDNFSTLGIRGNIASVGAAPPETPYAPIFPLIKRTPSPREKRRN